MRFTVTEAVVPASVVVVSVVVVDVSVPVELAPFWSVWVVVAVS